MAKKNSKAAKTAVKTLMLASVEDVEITSMSWVNSAIWFLQVVVQASFTTPSSPPGTQPAMTGKQKTAQIERWNGSAWVPITTEKEMTATGGGVYSVTFQNELMEGTVSVGDEIRAIGRAYWQAAWFEETTADDSETVLSHP